jgi:hypothetical protein
MRYITTPRTNLHSLALSTLNHLRLVARSGLTCLGAAMAIAILSLPLLDGTAVATEWGSPVRVLPFTLPCCVFEMAVLDLNGDGLDDVLAASGYYPLQNASIPIQILLNDGHGGFTDGTSQVIVGAIPQTVFPRKIVIADFNGDGKPDIFIADTGYDAAPFPGAQSTLLLSTPDGHYVDATANLPQQLAYTHSAAAADIDGSGHMALYLGNLGPGPGPQLLLNDGTGHFTISTGRLPRAQTDTMQNIYTQSQFVDVNGDGCPDLVLGGAAYSPSQNWQSVVLINDCNGYFHVQPNALPPKLFSDGVTLDIEPIKNNSSGRQDLILASSHSTYEGRALQYLLNTGSGRFIDESAQRINFQQDTGNWIEWAFLTDTTGQCRLDIFPSANSIDVNIFLNNGQNYFTQQASGLPDVFGLPYPIDLYNTGQTSFISLGSDGYYLVPAVSGSTCPNPPNPDAPTVSAIAPATGPAGGGTSVIITGANFMANKPLAATTRGPLPRHSIIVKFGATAAASLTVDSATSITATSPSGSGTVDVTVTTAAGTSATGAADQFTYQSAPGESQVRWRRIGIGSVNQSLNTGR